MYGSTSYGQLVMGSSQLLGGETGERIHAIRSFEAANARSAMRTTLAALVGRKNRLLRLTACERSTGRKTHVGLRSVPLRQIKGSEGREEDFDAAFLPVKEHDRDRWVGVLLAMRHGVTMPPVELIQVGDVYYVRDGHHRISAAHHLGYRDIEATVTRWE